MRPSPQEFFEDWTKPAFEVRVRGTVFLWGSAGISKAPVFLAPLLLHLRNDVFGEPITIGSRVESGTTSTIGVLAPGQCLTLPIQRIAGIYATCTSETTVVCVIKS